MSQKQAKKRRREEKIKAQHMATKRASTTSDHEEYTVRNLEELLKSGDIDEYAKACWSLGKQDGMDHPRLET